MNKIQKHWLFPRRIALAVGIMIFLLGIVLFTSLAAPECNDASAVCIHHSLSIETEQSDIKEPALQEPVAISTSCEDPGSTGWTGSACQGPSPTPTIPPDGNPGVSLP